MMNRWPTRSQPRTAFSLVELSIVLVILGLLVGGVLSGQSLIRAAELRSVATEFNNYRAAIHQFKDKYFEIPGDFTKATQFWGVDGHCGGSVYNSLTCNGDGNGYVNFYSALYGLGDVYEPTLFWNHLYKSGLIPQNTDGDIQSTFRGVPAKLGGAMWAMDKNERFQSTGCTVYIAQYDLYSHPAFQTLCLQTGSGTSLSAGGVMKAEEAWNIDTKMDDGRPDQGKLLVANDATVSSGCIDGPAANGGNTITSGNYQLGDTTKTCRLFFVLW